MDALELPDDEREALKALVDARRNYPEADHFEHDRTSVRMPGAREDVDLRIERDVLRRLGHKNLVRFEDATDSFGHGRWVFDVTATASDFT